MPKHLFIDTNVYLRIFRKTSDTLNEVEILFQLIDAGEISLYTTEQVIEEYFRNVEREIEEAFQEIRTITDSVELPRLAQQFPHASEIFEAFSRIQAAKKALIAEATTAAEEGELKADELIAKIFAAATEIERTNEIIEEARLRRELGNPPGKKDSLGDQINWECLLNGVPPLQDLSIISRDGDFSFKAGVKKIRQFLKDEWSDQKESDIRLFYDLKSYLAAEFPDFKDAKSVKKSAAITKLRSSGTFINTHKQIANLNEVYDQIKFNDAVKIFEALLNNDQVKWIATDDYVREFYSKLFKRYYSETARELDVQLYEVASYLNPDSENAVEVSDDDIPF